MMHLEQDSPEESELFEKYSIFEDGANVLNI